MKYAIHVVVVLVCSSILGVSARGQETVPARFPRSPMPLTPVQDGSGTWNFDDTSSTQPTNPTTLPQDKTTPIEAQTRASEKDGDVAEQPTAAETDHAKMMSEEKAEEPKKFPTARLTGFFHLDAAWFSQDQINQQTLGDIGDGLGFRRARLAAAGNVTDDVSYILEFDIAQSQARFVDVWFQLNQTRFGNVRIGRFRQPFGMSELTSVRELPFLERPLTFTQSPFRQTGVMLFDHRPDLRGTWAVSGYRFLSDSFGNVFSDSGGYGMATRMTGLLRDWGENHLLHVGFDYSYNDPGRGLIQLVSTNEVFVSQNPNLGPAGLSVLPLDGVTPFVNTGPLPTDDVQFFNVESALALGSLAIQSEARWVRVEQPDGTVAVFPGAYAQVRWMLTGESIPYSRANGVFGRVVPFCNFDRCGGIGAWELLGRVSHIDLNDAGVAGRRLTNFTVGCNWYLNQYTKLQFNWIHSSLNDVELGDSDANTFAIRAQLDF